MAFALVLTMSAGCASGYKASYVTGAVTKQFATESYDVYSEQFNKKIDECCTGGVCNPESPDVITKTELDECMGPAFNAETHDKIELAIKAYYDAAVIHTEAMKITEGDETARKAATNKILDTALSMLGLLPDGNKLVAKLKKLTGR